ncbi:alkyl/aryl-sulfatase [Verrucomicrobiaceae bacterium N1E253]|uniref:Alkyl/aryl-sulfatase n=1 Tax=Oceaniferula marina TaxID=2748318 RepID=A0A851GF66_9BACT|nr:alkyl/aryl-sulfatase [Oceaniferula marina]NWK55839.1 alkyl/aryl-sulfatase [Oceaniferula marina]
MKKVILFIMIVAQPLSVIHAEESHATKLLKQRSEHLKPVITKVSSSVYCASGYSPANISMIVGPEGLVIVDTGMFADHAKAVLKEFRKTSDLPIKAIILTHGHGDHTGGASVFMSEGEGVPAIYARTPFNTEGNHFDDGGVTINGLRGARQGGFRLPPEKRINNGIAPAVYPPKNRNVFIGDPPVPTETFRDGRKKISVAGLELELVAAPGETTDQLYVWFPKERVVFTGDNFYQSWPNLYAIRGTAYRDVRGWIRSLDMMIKEKPLHAVPGHTRPILGEKQTVEVLTNYRDALQHIFDKTIEGINQGMTPDELVSYVELPEHLQNLDYLREYYGNIEWGVRAIFTGYLGWFDGNPTHLFSLPPAEEAKRMVTLAGGEPALRKAAKQALADDDAQWCAELCDHLLALHPDDASARTLKAEALEMLAEKLVTATGRNYYLTVAQELRKPSSKE